MVVFFLGYSLKHWKDGLLRYLFWGNLLFLIFSSFSLLLTMRADRFGLTGFFGYSLLYYQVGLFFELLFFLTALYYKNTEQLVKEVREKEMLKARNLLQEYEKEMAVYKAQQEERERISADMHDELGSGMTAIRLMSEIARNKMQGNAIPPELGKISASANDVLNKMNAIIWSMNHNNDTLDSLLSYIRTYANEFFENTSIRCRVFIPERVQDIEISGVKRRNIFLCVKETLHNIVKHSKASQVAIRIQIDEELQIEISDDGVGMDNEKISHFGNGLKNMKRRMENLGGHYEIRSDEGTLTILRLVL
jgi:signal transduction histidine kinase